MGATYYLHEGQAKTGKPRYFFAKTMGPGMLSEMPKGFEVSESINGVVSVRKKTMDRTVVHEEDVKVVEDVVSRHPHLQGYGYRRVPGFTVAPHARLGAARNVPGGGLTRPLTRGTRNAPSLALSRHHGQ